MQFSELTERKLRASVDYSMYFESDRIDGVKILPMEIGKLNLPSGRLVACDPSTVLRGGGEACLPFAYAVEPGQYPVTLSVAKGSTPAMGDRYAAARIKFSENRPVKWLLALRGNENPAGLTRDGEYFGFQVDASFGCFVDEQGREPYLRLCRLLEQHGRDLMADFFSPQLKESYAKFPRNQREEGDWFNALIPGDDQINLAVFQTGFGEGVYPCYWGLDEEGEAAQLVADFFVFDPTVSVSPKPTEEGAL